MASVMAPDSDDHLRGIFEWYSKTFATPLHLVGDLPLDDILIAFYREYYRSMEAPKRHNEAIWLLETPEERKARAEADKRDEDAFLQRAREHNARVAAGGGVKGLAGAGAKVEAVLRKMRERAEAAINDGDGLRVGPTQPTPPAATPAPPPVVAEEPEITVTYMSPEEFEAQLDETPGPPPKKRR